MTAEKALIVSCSEKGSTFFSEKLRDASIRQITVVESCGDARRLLLKQDFDLVLINAPLRDESGETLARHIAGGSIAQVLLAVKSEIFESVSAACEDDGVLTVSKPVNKVLFWTALKLAIAAQSKLRHIQKENSKLKQKIEDIRIIDRAKCQLISRLKLSEEDAHRAIEKQAMDMRVSKRTIAEGILKTYEG